MNRRSFFQGLVPLVASTRVYFDLGATWQKHDSLWVVDADDMVWPEATFENLVPTALWRKQVMDGDALIIELTGCDDSPGPEWQLCPVIWNPPRHG